jgi:PAS domain S-box-containing protein
MDRATLDEILSKSIFPWWEWDVVRNIVQFNELKVHMLGYESSAFAGRGYEVFTRIVHPDDVGQTMDAMLKVLKGETKLYQTDYRIMSSNGTYKWFMDRGFVIEEDGAGKPLRIRGIVIDLGSENEKAVSAAALMDILNQSVRQYDRRGKSVLTVCANCRRVKHTRDEWVMLSDAMLDLVGEDLSHGICPDCLRTLYPDIAEMVLARFPAG